jgi:hypothetical protein
VGGAAARGLERDAGGRHIAIAQEGLDPVERENLRRLGRELLGEEPGVISNDDSGPFDSRFLDVVDDPLGGQPDILEGEILADDTPPPRGPELDHRVLFITLIPSIARDPGGGMVRNFKSRTFRRSDPSLRSG